MINERPKVLIFIDWYYPGFQAGGPVRTIRNLIAHLKNRFEFFVVSRDTDMGEHLSYNDVISDEWTRLDDGSHCYYISEKCLNYGTIGKIISEVKPDTIHINSMFSNYFTIAPLRYVKRNGIRSRVVVGPRGMLSEGALSIKPVKKKLFLWYAKMTGLYADVTWHASTKVEQQEIRKHFGNNADISVAIDLSQPLNSETAARKKEYGSLRLIFIGRINRVKNLHICLNALRELGLNPDQSIEFDIYGPVEQEKYFNECQSIISNFPPGIKASFRGPVKSSLIPDLLKEYHFLFLLTANENYGHAIIESLVSAMPVIISDKTPWQQLEEKNAGWDFDPQDIEQVRKILLECVSMDDEKYAKLSRGAFELGRSIANNPDSVEANHALLSGER